MQEASLLVTYTSPQWTEHSLKHDTVWGELLYSPRTNVTVIKEDLAHRNSLGCSGKWQLLFFFFSIKWENMDLKEHRSESISSCLLLSPFYRHVYISSEARFFTWTFFFSTGKVSQFFAQNIGLTYDTSCLCIHTMCFVICNWSRYERRDSISGIVGLVYLPHNWFSLWHAEEIRCHQYDRLSVAIPHSCPREPCRGSDQKALGWLD